MDTTEILFALIRFELCGMQLDDAVKFSINEAKFSELYDLSNFHDIAHIIGSALSKTGLLGNNEISSKFKKKIMEAVYRYERMNFECESICKVFEKEKIPYIHLKGKSIGKYYPESWYRTSCDIDFLIENKNLDNAKQVLRTMLGYSINDKQAYHDVSLFSPGGVHVELHFSLKENRRNLDMVLERAWDYSLPMKEGYGRKFTNEFFYFYILAHMAYHFVRGGCGIRSIIDLWVLKNNIEIDNLKLYSLIDEANLRTFYVNAETLCSVWLEKGVHTELTKQMEEYILRSGVYGLEENHIAIIHERIGGHRRYILHRIFVPYRNLKIRYPILEKKTWLFPFLQVYRWYELLLSKSFIKIKSEFEISNSITEEKINNITKMIKDLGV